MSVDVDQVVRLRDEVADYPTEGLVIEGVPVDLPLSRTYAGTAYRNWQRRVVEGVTPDSPNADAPERMPFRILYALTEGIKTSHLLEDVFAGSLRPLASLYQVTTKRGKNVPVAFHALSVKGASRGEQDSKGFKEDSFVLLCRLRNGTLNETLINRLLERFRAPLGELDLAQRTILQKMEPGWTPAKSPHISIPPSMQGLDVPYDPVACELFQRDLGNLLNAELTQADFFHSLNMLLGLHLGLYQPRLALRLNPEMDLLLAALASEDPAHLAELERLVSIGEKPLTHPFKGSIPLRAPPAGEMRSVPHGDPVRVAYDSLETRLANFHFSLLTLQRVRQLAWAYLSHHLELDEQTVRSMCRTPLSLVQRLHDDPQFRSFLSKASVVMAARFISDQLGEQRQETAWKSLSEAPTGLHALRTFYEIFNRDGARNKTATRAHRQGIAMTVSLLAQSDYGIIQRRRGLGAFFELGAGMLPLLLLLTIGDAHKLQVDRFWSRLADYGFDFDAAEQERLLRRLKDMGLYERYSDAGEANYVRNLLTIRNGGDR